MKIGTAAGITALFTILALTTAARAQERANTKAPPSKEVIAKYLQAIGGKESVLKYGSTRIRGRWEMPAMSQSGEFELLRAKPNKQLMRLKIGDQGEIVNGYDGKTAWMVNPFTGPMVLEDKMLAQASEEAEYYNVLRDEKNYKSIETIGGTEFDGKPAVELKLISKSGREAREYFDSKSGLLIGSKGIQESPQGTAEVTVAIRDYRKMGDLLQPTRLAIQMPGFEQILNITSVEYDNIKEQEFDMPAEVNVLLKK